MNQCWPSPHNWTFSSTGLCSIAFLYFHIISTHTIVYSYQGQTLPFSRAPPHSLFLFFFCVCVCVCSAVNKRKTHKLSPSSPVQLSLVLPIQLSTAHLTWDWEWENPVLGRIIIGYWTFQNEYGVRDEPKFFCSLVKESFATLVYYTLFILYMQIQMVVGQCDKP